MMLGPYSGTPTHPEENCRLIYTHGVGALSSADGWTLTVQSNAAYGVSFVYSFDQTPVVQAVVRTLNAMMAEMRSQPPMNKPIWFFSIKNGAQFETRSFSVVLAKIDEYITGKPKLSAEASGRLTTAQQNAKRIFAEIDFGMKIAGAEVSPPDRNWLNEYIRARIFVIGDRDFTIPEPRIAAETMLAHIQAEMDHGYLQGKTLGSQISLKEVFSGAWWRAQITPK